MIVMQYKMGVIMRKVIQFGFSTLLWGIVLIMHPQLVVKIFDIALMPIVCTAAAVLGTLIPSFFQMGCDGFKNANVLARMMPIVLVASLCYAVTFIPQTYVTAASLSILVGNASSYLGYLLGCLVKVKVK